MTSDMLSNRWRKYVGDLWYEDAERSRRRSIDSLAEVQNRCHTILGLHSVGIQSDNDGGSIAIFALPTPVQEKDQSMLNDGATVELRCTPQTFRPSVDVIRSAPLIGTVEVYHSLRDDHGSLKLIMLIVQDKIMLKFVDVLQRGNHQFALVIALDNFIDRCRLHILEQLEIGSMSSDSAQFAVCERLINGMAHGQIVWEQAPIAQDCERDLLDWSYAVCQNSKDATFVCLSGFRLAGNAKATASIIRSLVEKQTAKILVCAESSLAIDKILKQCAELHCVRMGEGKDPLVSEYAFTTRIRQTAAMESCEVFQGHIDRFFQGLSEMDPDSPLFRKVVKATALIKSKLSLAKRKAAAEVFSQYSVVFITTTDCYRPHFKQYFDVEGEIRDLRLFDYVIIVDAEEMTEMDTWMPLCVAKKAILTGSLLSFGDKNVECASSVSTGAGTRSLFHRLINFPSSRSTTISQCETDDTVGRLPSDIPRDLGLCMSVSSQMSSENVATLQRDELTLPRREEGDISHSDLRARQFAEALDHNRRISIHSASGIPPIAKANRRNRRRTNFSSCKANRAMEEVSQILPKTCQLLQSEERPFLPTTRCPNITTTDRPPVLLSNYQGNRSLEMSPSKFEVKKVQSEAKDWIVTSQSCTDTRVLTKYNYHKEQSSITFKTQVVQCTSLEAKRLQPIEIPKLEHLNVKTKAAVNRLESKVLSKAKRLKFKANSAAKCSQANVAPDSKVSALLSAAAVKRLDNESQQAKHSEAKVISVAKRSEGKAVQVAKRSQPKAAPAVKCSQAKAGAECKRSEAKAAPAGKGSQVKAGAEAKRSEAKAAPAGKGLQVKAGAEAKRSEAKAAPAGKALQAKAGAEAKRSLAKTAPVVKHAESTVKRVELRAEVAKRPQAETAGVGQATAQYGVNLLYSLPSYEIEASRMSGSSFSASTLNRLSNEEPEALSPPVSDCSTFSLLAKSFKGVLQQFLW